MAQTHTDALIDSWKTKANLNLSDEEEQKLKVWFTSAAEHLNVRRQVGKEILGQLKQAVDNNNSAKAEELLQKLREGFRQLAEGREKALDEFDKILKPEQRARIVVHAVQQAKELDRPVEHLVDNLLSHTTENN